MTRPVRRDTMKHPNEGDERMAKEILLLLGSPRTGGNTRLLARAFRRGAEEAGHRVTEVDVSRGQIRPCLACGRCLERGGVCVQRDGMAELDPLLDTADALVLACPVYYSGMPAQVKAVVDRLFARLEKGCHVRECALLTASADGLGESGVECLISHFRAVAAYLKWTNRGVVYAPGLWAAGDAAGGPAEWEPRALGREF